MSEATSQEHGRNDGPGHWLTGWRRWLELSGGLVAAEALAWIIQPEALYWQPVFWVVLVFAARYGYGIGVLGGMLAAAMVLLRHEGLDELLSVALERRVLFDSLAYPLVGIVVGFVADVPREEARQAKERARLAHLRAEDLAVRHAVLLQAKESLDHQIIGQTQTVVSVYEAARELETLEPTLIPKALVGLMARFLGAEAAAVYLGETHELTLVAHCGESPDRSSMLAITTLEEAEAEGGAPQSESPWLLAVSLRHPDGRIRGGLVIERMPFLRLNAGCRQLLLLLSEWGGAALMRAEAHQAATEARRDHPVTGLMRQAFTLERAETEFLLARRYGLALSLVLVRERTLASLEGSDWNERAVAIAATLKAALRNIDLAGHLPTQDQFLLILPVTPLEGANILAGRLQNTLPTARIAAGSFVKGEPGLPAMLAQLEALVDDND